MLAAFLSMTIAGSLVILGVFAVAAVIAAVKIGGRRKDATDDQDAISTSRFTIPVTLIVPTAGKAEIDDTLDSLLTLDYPEFEVIVVAERLDDAAIQSLKARWQLEPREFFYRASLQTSEVRRIFRTSAHPRLMVVEKAPGGMADALNCGVNLARFRYVAAVAAGVTCDMETLLRTMTAALRDPGRVIATSSHLERVGSGFQRLASARSLMASRVIWPWFDCGLPPQDAVVIWRRDAILQAGGFTPLVADTALDMAFRLQSASNRSGTECMVRTSEIFGQIATTTLAERTRGMADRQLGALQTLLVHRHGFGSDDLGRRAVPYLVATEVVLPFLEAWAIVGTAIGAAAGWFPWLDVALAALIVAFGQALVSNAALLLRGSAEGAAQGRELVQLILTAPAEFILRAPQFGFARLIGWLRFMKGSAHRSATT